MTSVPQYEGLAVVDFVNFSKDHPQCLTYLPDEQDWLHLDKKWMCDILYTIEKDAVQEMINIVLSQRKQRI